MLDSIFVAAHFVVMYGLYIGDNIQRELAKRTDKINSPLFLLSEIYYHI